MKQKGFTLIELLVVIAIISMLSSVVLGKVQDARIKALNTSVTEQAHVYILGIENVNLDYGSGSPLNLNTIGACLSDIPQGSICLTSNPEAAPQLKTAVDKYMERKTMPTFMNGSPLATGLPQYACIRSNPGDPNSNCRSFSLYWHIKGSSNNCPLNATSVHIPSLDITTCTYIEDL